MNTIFACPKCQKLNRVSLDKAAQASPICGSCKALLPIHEGVQEISFSSLKKLIEISEHPVVVDFWADWCGPCKAFAPVFKSAAKELSGKMVFAKLDTEANPEGAQMFHIRGIPTLIVFNKGVEVDRKSGAMPLPVFLDYLKRWS